MIRRLILLPVFFALTIVAAWPQAPGTDSAKSLKPGEVAQLGDGVSLRVTRASTSPFTTMKLKGEAVVVVLEFDAGKKSATISYKLSANTQATEVYLGNPKIAPRAVIEDFPSWGSDNDKEVDILDPAENGAVLLSFERKGTVSVLFDVPAGQAKSAQKFTLVLRMLKPSDEQHSFVVTL